MTRLSDTLKEISYFWVSNLEFFLTIYIYQFKIQSMTNRQSYIITSRYRSLLWMQTFTKNICRYLRNTELIKLIQTI